MEIYEITKVSRLYCEQAAQHFLSQAASMTQIDEKHDGLHICSQVKSLPLDLNTY